ncbi:hypothetical protein NQ176_g6280 [Zarea fungicola]|uniref:Uncharacterized protein n=1 Tax=Zarea fungicola TaxID=93591 RepID=A0ACC1N407_9HYPO|nr:hypothetical protein NQ176_g6280 [Lecanicillium fungicola]
MTGAALDYNVVRQWLREEIETRLFCQVSMRMKKPTATGGAKGKQNAQERRESADATLDRIDNTDAGLEFSQNMMNIAGAELSSRVVVVGEVTSIDDMTEGKAMAFHASKPLAVKIRGDADERIASRNCPTDLGNSHSVSGGLSPF